MFLALLEQPGRPCRAAYWGVLCLLAWPGPCLLVWACLARQACGGGWYLLPQVPHPQDSGSSGDGAGAGKTRLSPPENAL